MISLKATLEKYKLDNAELCALLDQTKQSYMEKVGELQASHSTTNTNLIIINSLNKDLEDLRSQFLEMESKLRSAVCEREEFEARCSSLTEKFASLSSIKNESLDEIFVRFDEMKIEHPSNKLKLSEVTEKLMQVEVQSSGYKTRCEELCAEIANLESSLLESRVQIEYLKLERDNSQATRDTVEGDVILLKAKLSEVHKVWLETQRELEVKEGHYRKFEVDIEQIEVAVAREITQFKDFRREVASLLTDDYFKCEPTMEEIKEKVKLLMVSSKHRGLVSLYHL
jgi:chromosome segregation ATPase